MADDNVVNGAKSGDGPVDVDRTDSDVAELKKKIEVLEPECVRNEMKEIIRNLSINYKI